MAISIHAGGSVQKRLRFVLPFGNQARSAMALIENGANVDCPNAKRLVRYLRLRNLLQHFVVCQLYYVCIAIALFRE